MNHFRLFLP